MLGELEDGKIRSGRFKDIIGVAEEPARTFASRDEAVDFAIVWMEEVLSAAPEYSKMLKPLKEFMWASDVDYLERINNIVETTGPFGGPVIRCAVLPLMLPA